MNLSVRDTKAGAAGKLSLAFRAIERRTAGLHNPTDGTCAVGCRAGLAFAVVGAKSVLEISQFAVCLAVIL